MSDEKGQIGDPDRHASDTAALRIVLREEAGTSSTDTKWKTVKGLAFRAARRLLHIWLYFSRGMTMGVRAMVLDADGRVFLVRHSYVSGWHLPGGGIEHGQHAVAALEMELREEGNLVVGGVPQLFGIYFNPVASRRDHVLLYVIRDFRQTGPKVPDHEIVECGFFPLDALPVGTTRSTRQRLREVLLGETPASIW